MSCEAASSGQVSKSLLLLVLHRRSPPQQPQQANQPHAEPCTSTQVRIDNVISTNPHLVTSPAKRSSFTPFCPIPARGGPSYGALSPRSPALAYVRSVARPCSVSMEYRVHGESVSSTSTLPTQIPLLRRLHGGGVELRLPTIKDTWLVAMRTHPRCPNPKRAGIIGVLCVHTHYGVVHTCASPDHCPPTMRAYTLRR